MAYSIQGKDIVLAGFESGIADTPYAGIADMRNIEIISMPGEGFAEFAQVAASAPPTLSAVAYTASAAADTLTISSTTGLYEGVAIVLASNTATGLSNGVVYYVRNISGNTFQVSAAPASAIINITADGTGTLTTYTYGNHRGTSAQAPISYWVDKTGAAAGNSGLYLVDGSNYVWVIFNSALGGLPANALIFLGNIGGVGASSIVQNGVAIWNGYLLLFGIVTSGVDYARMSTLITTSVTTAWTYGWQNMGTNSVNGRINMLVSQEDGNLYWTSDTGLGSIIEQPGTNFNPTNSATYAITSTALLVPESDEATCVAELGTNLLIGGQRNFVYVWNKVDPGFSDLINIPDTYTHNIVAASQNAYVFAGNRGRIYITNGSGMDLYKKFPDYLTGIVNPVISWLDANFIRNQLIFTVSARSNSNTTLTTVNGVWAIDLDSDALRMINKTTNSGYGGSAPMAVEMPAFNSGVTTGITGTGITVGWYSGTTYGVDVGSSNPYSNYESYIQTDLIPVGTYLDPFSPSQVEFKLSAPLVDGESVRVSYRTNISENFTQIFETTTVGAISGWSQTNFQKVQWVQFLIELKSTATNPSYCRLTEMRVRDFPSGKDSNNNNAYGQR